MEPMKATSVNSRAEELFVQLFCEAFGPEKTENLQVQYPCVDIYGRHRYIDFALESPESKIAIEIDGETYHNPSKVSENKYADDLLKQNSLIYDNWKVYRWIYSQLEKQPEKVKDELITFLGTSGRVALPDVVDYFIDFYEDRKAHGMIAEKSTSIYQKGGYTRKDVEKNILSNPFKRFEDMRFLMRCKDVETIEVNPIIFRKLTREDWLHIVDVCDKSLEKYYLRLKK